MQVKLTKISNIRTLFKAMFIQDSILFRARIRQVSLHCHFNLYFFQIGNVEGWLRPLSPKGKYAVGILNGSIYGEPQHINKTIKELGLKDESGYTLTDVFTLQQYGPYNLTDRLTIQIHPTSIFLAIAIPVSHKT